MAMTSRVSSKVRSSMTTRMSTSLSSCASPRAWDPKSVTSRTRGPKRRRTSAENRPTAVATEWLSGEPIPTSYPGLRRCALSLAECSLAVLLDERTHARKALDGAGAVPAEVLAARADHRAASAGRDRHLAEDLGVFFAEGMGLVGQEDE